VPSARRAAPSARIEEGQPAVGQLARQAHRRVGQRSEIDRDVGRRRHVELQRPRGRGPGQRDPLAAQQRPDLTDDLAQLRQRRGERHVVQPFGELRRARAEAETEAPA